MEPNIVDAGFWGKVTENLWSGSWWGDNLAGFLVFSILVGLLYNLIRWFFLWLSTQRYRRWSTVVIPKSENRSRYEHPLLWEEAREIIGSKYKQRQYIQSVVSSEGGWLENGEIDVDNPRGWVYMDKAERAFVFHVANFPKRPEGKLVAEYECRFREADKPEPWK